jgi:hypothetical protein
LQVPLIVGKLEIHGRTLPKVPGSRTWRLCHAGAAPWT